MSQEETDMLIVGSGVAGGFIAEHLLARGTGSVTMLEAGPPVAMRDRRHWLDYVTTGRLPYDDLSDRPADFESSGDQAWHIPGGRLMARGGSTLHWGGWCPRMKPEDFELAQRLGTGGLDWPWSYEDLSPYYDRAEAWLGVAGDSTATDPPRKNPYPFEAPPFTEVDGLVINAMEKRGISYGHIPIARNRRAHRGMPACITTGTCNYCPVGGRFTADQCLDRASRSTHFRLKTRSPVLRLLCDRKRHIHGAEYLDLASGTRRQIHAQKIVVCAGALETPKILLASTGRHWPNGIGNDTDQVGRYLIANPYFYARGTRETNPTRLAEEVHFATLGSRHWDQPKYQPEGKFFLNRGKSPLFEPGKLMAAGRSRAQIDAALTGRHTIELQGTMQTFSYAENRVTLAAGKTRFGLPRTRIDMPINVIRPKALNTNLGRMQQVLTTMGYQIASGDAGMGAYPQRGDHAMCTTRISPTPETGVVNADLLVHGTDNLYILSNAVFPSGSPANPTLTLVALATRFMDRG